MKMDVGMDTGDIIDMQEIPIDKFETSETLFNKF
jgi:methionyl-tRNA formyltransferase